MKISFLSSILYILIGQKPYSNMHSDWSKTTVKHAFWLVKSQSNMRSDWSKTTVKHAFWLVKSQSNMHSDWSNHSQTCILIDQKPQSNIHSDWSNHSQTWILIGRNWIYVTLWDKYSQLRVNASWICIHAIATLDPHRAALSQYHNTGNGQLASLVAL